MDLDLAQFFTKREMVFEPLQDGGVRSAFATTLSNGQEYVFGFFVLSLDDNFGDRYVRFTIVPFVEQPPAGYPADLSAVIGQINHDLPQLKFAFDADGDLELALDMPIAQLDDARFEATMQVLADYAAIYYPEFESLVARQAESGDL